MGSTHRPGKDYGIDHGIVAILLLWIAITIVLLEPVSYMPQQDFDAA
jgi:hypothetical protein